MKTNSMILSRYLKPAAALALFLTLGALSAFGQPFATTGSTTVSVNVAAEASIRIDTSSTQLSNTSGTVFNPYTGTTNFTYKVRTASGGTGSITVKLADFTPSGGPSIVTPPTSGDALTYSCTAGASASPCTGSITANTTDTKVADFGHDAHSTQAGDTGSVTWGLTNDPQYKVNSYSATATFTISAS
jgi:hypothetical protein